MKTAAFLFLTTCLCWGQGHEVRLPRLLGNAHIALYVSDLANARVFYKEFLGFDEPYTLKRKDAPGVDRIVFIKINEDQYLELFAEKSREEGVQLNHISFLTDDIEAMRKYLASRGVKVPENVGKGQIGNSNFNINDSDGDILEIVEYQPDGWTRREKGKFLPDTRVSTHMIHMGCRSTNWSRRSSSTATSSDFGESGEGLRPARS